MGVEFSYDALAFTNTSIVDHIELAFEEFIIIWVWLEVFKPLLGALVFLEIILGVGKCELPDMSPSLMSPTPDLG